MHAKQRGVQRINCICDHDGALQSDPDSICEVFAKFYEDLYTEAEPAQATQDLTRPDVETLVTADEVIAALKKMKI